MRVRFVDVCTKEETFITDLDVVPRIGDLVSPDCPKFGGEVVNVVWRLNRYIDNEAIVYYITHEDKERLNEKKRQARRKRK